jgi:hypothetical protein
MLIEVTAWDIERGWAECGERNPVSLAIRRATGIPTSAGPGAAVIDYATPWQSECWLPDEAVNWLEAFDKDEPVEPFSFELGFDKDAHETRRAGRR